MLDGFVYALTLPKRNTITDYVEEHPQDLARFIPDGKGGYAIHMRTGFHLFVIYGDKKATHRASRIPRRSANHLSVDFVSIIPTGSAFRTPGGLFYPPLPDTVE